MHCIIGIGHSHLICFDDAAEDLLQDAPNRFKYVPICFVRREYHPPVVVHDRVHVANPVWVNALADMVQGVDASILLAMPGAEWWYWSLTPGPEPFDFIDPLHDDGLPPCGQVIPYDLVMNRARGTFRYVRLIVDGVRSVSDAPLYLSPPPPPMRDIASLFAEHTLDRPAAGQKHAGLRHILKQLAPTIQQYGFSSDSFRMKSWRAATRAVREICADGGVTYLPPPAAGVDEEGFLRPDMVSDLVHANRKWGALQLEHMLMMLSHPKGTL